MSHLAYIIYSTLSPVDVFYHATLCPIWPLLHSTLFLVDILTFRILSHAAFISFVLMSFRHYLPFDVLSFQRFSIIIHCFFCQPFVPFEVFAISVFFTVDVFYFNILAVNSLACPPPRRSHCRRNWSGFRQLCLLHSRTSILWWRTTQPIPSWFKVIKVPGPRNWHGCLSWQLLCWFVVVLCFGMMCEIAAGRTTTLQGHPILPNDGTETS